MKSKIAKKLFVYLNSGKYNSLENSETSVGRTHNASIKQQQQPDRNSNIPNGAGSSAEATPASKIMEIG